MDTEKEIKCVYRHLLRVNIMLTIALILIGACGVKSIINTTSTTKALSEVAQKVGVEFPTKTNNVFGVWQIVKPQ